MSLAPSGEQVPVWWMLRRMKHKLVRNNDVHPHRGFNKWLAILITNGVGNMWFFYVLIVFIGLSVYFSPQWVLWLAPLCLPLARGNRLFTGLLIALDLATYFTFPVFSPVWGPLDAGGVEHAVYARFAVLAALVVVLLWQERRRGRANAAARQDQGQACGWQGSGHSAHDGHDLLASGRHPDVGAAIHGNAIRQAARFLQERS